jgi:hypothetical protein
MPERSIRPVRERSSDDRCDAVLYHGPGHQSRARCRVEGPHEIHEAVYLGTVGQWRTGQYNDKLRAKGIEFNPASYREQDGMTGFFNEPPQEEWDA